MPQTRWNMQDRQPLDFGRLMSEWLREQGYEPKAEGNQTIRCPLPDHEDKKPSCSVNAAAGVWHCHGCNRKGGYMDLMKALGQEIPYSSRPPYSPPKPRSIVTPIQSRKNGDRPPGAKESPTNGIGEDMPQSKTYEWCDMDGNVYTQNRTDFPDGTKSIKWAEPTPNNGKVNEIFYPATLTEDGGTVVVAEGAKSSDAVFACGKCDAFAIVSSNQLPGDDLIKQHLFAYNEVVLWPDNDDPGHAAMDTVMSRLLVLGYPGTIRRVDVSDMPEKGDAADLDDDGRWEKVLDAKPVEETGEQDEQDESEPANTLQSFSFSDKDIGTEYPPRILSIAGKNGAILSLGEVAILSAEGGIGKSTLSAQIASDIATCGLDNALYDEGVPICDGVFHAHTGGPVLMLSYEDSASAVKRRLLNAMPDGWDTDLLGNIYGIAIEGKPLFGILPETFNEVGPLDTWEALEKEIIILQPRLIILDPALSAFTGNSNQAEHVRAFVEGLCVLAKAANCAVLMVAHSNKESRKENDPFSPGQVGGSTHWTDRARGVITLTRQKAGIQLAVVKANYGPSRYGVFIDPVHQSQVDAEWDSDDDGELLRFCKTGDWAREPHRDTDPHTASQPGIHLQAIKDCYVRVLEEGKVVGKGALHDAVKMAYPDMNIARRNGEQALKELIDEGTVIATDDPNNRQKKILSLRGIVDKDF